MYIQIVITYHVLSTICRKKKCVFVEVKLGYAQNCICSFGNEVGLKVNKPLLEMQGSIPYTPKAFLSDFFFFKTHVHKMFVY